MRLYLSADSKNNIGYVPDWIRVSYHKDGKEFELTLDIQGEIGYDPHTLSCRCKGELVPWVLCDIDTGNETNYKELETLSTADIAKIVCNSDTYEIGIYPVGDYNESKRAENDVLSNCTGFISIYADDDHYYDKRFEFDTELNIY